MYKRVIVFVIAGVLAGIVLIPVALITVPYVTVNFLLTISPNPPLPEYKYGEFPFRLEYEIDGKNIVVEDTVICKFDGIEYNGGQGKIRKWESYLASTGEESLLLWQIDETGKIYCFVGDAEYYMGDEKYPEKRPLAPRVYIVSSDFTYTDDNTLSQKRLLEKYNIEFIGWEFTDPITNTFK